MRIAPGIAVDDDQLEELCRRFHVRELSVFGSSVAGPFRSDSDIDLLVEFDPGARVGLFELGALHDELVGLLGREVDLVPKGGLKPLIRDEVLGSAQVLFAA